MNSLFATRSSGYIVGVTPLRPSLTSFQIEAGACVRCHELGLLHVHEDGRRSRPLFHEDTTGRSRVLCVMEAPNFEDTYDVDKGRLTIHPETDPTGRFLAELLASVDLTPTDVVCTNAVLCLPAGSGGRHPVTPQLRKAYRPWLAKLIDAVDPLAVISLGTKPLEALNGVERHGLTLRQGVGKLHDWYGRKLLPLYHPGQLGRVTRKAEAQRRDIQALRSVLPAP